jgi:hypothetical protein
MAGAVTQISLSFLPLVGTICALRDCLADIHYRDLIGFCLNLLALTPIVGGIPKTLDVTRSVWHMGHIIRRSRHVRAQASGSTSVSYASYAPSGRRVKPGLFVLSLLAMLLLASSVFAFLRTSSVATVCGGPQIASCTMNVEVGASLALLLGLGFMALAWIAGLVQAAFRGNWGWFFGVMLLNPLSTLLYSLVGPR